MRVNQSGSMTKAVGMLSVALGLTIGLAVVTSVAQAEKQEQPVIRQLMHNAQEAAQKLLEAANAAKPSADAPKLEPARTPAPGAPKPTPLVGRRGKLRMAMDQDRMNLHVEDVDVRVVLALLSRKNHTNIIAHEGVSGQVSCNLYDVTMQQALEALLLANRFAYERVDNVIHVYTEKELQELTATRQPLVEEVYKPNYVKAAELEKLIKPILSDRGSLSITTASQKGIAASADEAGGDDLATQDVLMIRDTAVNIKRIMTSVRKVDVRPLQVMIEITMLNVVLSESNHLGVQFEALSGFKFVDNDGTFNTDGTVSHTAAPLANYDNPLGRIGTQGFASGTGSGMKIGYVDGNVSLFLEALEAVGDTNVLASPKLVVLNKQKAEIVIGERLGFRTRTSTETSTVEQIEWMDVGTQLRCRPWISDSGDIRLEIHPERSTGQINPDTELPEKSTTEVTTNIMVRDGQTVVIGGLMLESTQNTTSQVPFFGSLPILGAAFRSKTDTQDKSELVILITPRIVRDEEAAKEAEDALKTYQQRHRRMLQSMAFYGRHRLASTHYEIAQLCRRNGWDRLAQWYAMWTLHFSPNHLGANKLWDELCEARHRQQTGDLTRETVERLIVEDEHVATAQN